MGTWHGKLMKNKFTIALYLAFVHIYLHTCTYTCTYIYVPRFLEIFGFLEIKEHIHVHVYNTILCTYVTGSAKILHFE